MFTRITDSLARRRAELKDREGGFTLVELLVVVIIIGILAAIAIPIYLGIQNGAKNSEVKSDLTNAKLSLIAAATQDSKFGSSYGGGTYDHADPAPFPAVEVDGTAEPKVTLDPFGATQGKKVDLKVTWVDETNFCVTGSYDGIGDTFYINQDGGVTEKDPGNC